MFLHTRTTFLLFVGAAAKNWSRGSQYKDSINKKKRKKKEIGLRKRQDKIKAEFKLLNVKREAEDAECHILESTKRSTSPTSAENVRPKVKKNARTNVSEF